MAIIISQNGKNAVKVDKSTFDKENYLQKYIYDNPESIPLYDIKEDIRLLILAREFSTNSGPIDAIGIDKDGEVYIVETKLYKNPDKRTVVAQALDYGAALWKHSGDFNEFTSILSEHTQRTFNLSLPDKLQDFFGLADDEVPILLDRVKSNLDDGVLRFVVLMDKLDPRLKDLILYVNQNSQFDIYAVELEYYKHDTYEIIIPKIYGSEVKKDIAVKTSSGSARRKWTEEEVLEEARKTLDQDTFSAFKKLFDFSIQNFDNIKLGTGTTRGSFGPAFTKISPRSIFTLTTDGSFSPNFGWLNDSEEAILVRDNFSKELNALGFNFTEEDLTKFTTLSPDEWVPKVDDLISVLNRVLFSK